MKAIARIFIILFSLLYDNRNAHGQFSEGWVRQDSEAENFVNLPVEKQVLENYLSLLVHLHDTDVVVRRKAHNSKLRADGMAINGVDSINTKALFDFYSRFGIPTLNKINIPNDSLRSKYDSDRSLLFLHNVVNSQVKFFELMEQSVLSKVSNMRSLMDLTATYLFRITEFTFEDKFFCVPLPDVTDSLFGKFYIRSVIDFLGYYFEIAKRGQQQFIICRNPFHDITYDTFIESTMMINEKSKNEGLVYHTTFETLVLNVLNNFEYYKQSLIHNKSEYMFIVYQGRDNKGWTAGQFD